MAMLRGHLARQLVLVLLVIVLGALHIRDPQDTLHCRARTMMMDDYCIKCHPDAYNGWFHSAHHFSSFNNKPYLFSVQETRRVALARDGSVKASRWCAGCHDAVPFLSGAFDDPNFDIE